LKRKYIKLNNQEIYDLYKEIIIITSYYAVGVLKYREYVDEFKKFCEENGIEIDEHTKGNLVF